MSERICDASSRRHNLLRSILRAGIGNVWVGSLLFHRRLMRLLSEAAASDSIRRMQPATSILRRKAVLFLRKLNMIRRHVFVVSLRGIFVYVTLRGIRY